jgi:hypothetical protein
VNDLGGGVVVVVVVVGAGVVVVVVGTGVVVVVVGTGVVVVVATGVFPKQFIVPAKVPFTMPLRISCIATKLSGVR